MAHLDLTLFLWEKVILKKRSRLWNPESLNLNYSHLNSAIAVFRSLGKAIAF